MTARYVLEIFLMLEVLMYPGPVIDHKPSTSMNAPQMLDNDRAVCARIFFDA
jgi:hypothetical protein